jgi:hypothetical protein
MRTEGDPRPLHEQGDGQARYQEFSGEYQAHRPARVRLRVRDVAEDIWSPRDTYIQAELEVACGSVNLSLEFAGGRTVESALIVPWKFD